MDEARLSAAKVTVRKWHQFMKALTGPDNQATSIAKYYRRRSDRDEYLGSLISNSRDSPGAWDGLRLIAEQHRQAREPIPRELQLWLIDVVMERAPRSRRDPYPNEARDDMIAGCVLVLVLLDGFNATRSRVTRTIRKNGRAGDAGAGDSACDVVGQEFGLSYKTIEAIWTQSFHHRSEVRAGLECAGILLDKGHEIG